MVGLVTTRKRDRSGVAAPLDVKTLFASVEAAPPVDAAEVVAAALTDSLEARDVSFLIADYSGRSLIRLSHVRRMHLAARHPDRVRSLSLHSGWHASDDYLKIVVEQWRVLATTLPTVADVVIQGIFPWCFTPEMYAERPEFVETLVSFVRGRPAQPVDAFLAQTDAVLAHDAGAALGTIDTPTLITFGARDVVCSTRFAEPLKGGIPASELVVFEHLSHAGLHEDPETFNRVTLDFLLRQRS